MKTKDDIERKASSNECLPCKKHAGENKEEKEDILKGIVDSYRRLDGLPLIETKDGRVVILKEFKNKPEIGEDVEYIITASHGNIMYAKRVGD
ncbi:MAG: hypothetical protein SWO11_03450 [Thermodesulfobacteriota bacterium]|nr:hypothetical protein [Thermodesulfobacteriota bacterium]